MLSPQLDHIESNFRLMLGNEVEKEYDVFIQRLIKRSMWKQMRK